MEKKTKNNLPKERKRRREGIRERGGKSESHLLAWGCCPSIGCKYPSPGSCSVSAREDPREQGAWDSSDQGLMGDRASETWSHQDTQVFRDRDY